MEVGSFCSGFKLALPLTRFRLHFIPPPLQLQKSRDEVVVLFYLSDRKMKITNICIAEGDPLLRLGLKIELTRTGEFRVVGEARNATAAASAIRMSVPDIALVDFSLPGPPVAENVRIFREIAPSMKIVMLTTFGDEEKVKSSMAAGVDGYIMRSIENCKIVEIIKNYLLENSAELSRLEELNGHFAFVW